MKNVRYTTDAAKSLKKYGNIAERILRTVDEYAMDGRAHRNQVTPLVGSSAKRLRIGDFRVIFEETSDEIIVTKIGPRGNVYD